MCNQLKILCLLVYKNYLVRKRRWVGCIIECFFPVFFIASVLSVRSSYNIEPEHVVENTYYPTLTKADLVHDHIPKSILHLYYKPRNNFTDELMKDVTRCAELPHDQLFGFDNEDDMLQTYETQLAKDELISVMAIDFGDTKFERRSVPERLVYTMRSSQQIPPNFYDLEPLGVASDKLIQEIPIVPLQMCLDDVFIHKAAPNGARKPTIVIQKMPYPPYDNINSNELSIQYGIYTIGGLIFMATVYLIPAYVSAEKTTGVCTLLKLNGVRSYQNFLSWLVAGILFNVIPVCLVTMFLKTNLYDQKPIYYHSNCGIIWLALFINSAHIYAFCIHIASYFGKVWLAQAVSMILPLVTNMSMINLENTENYIFVPYLGIFCPTVSTARIFDELNRQENELTGVQWSNIFETSHPSLTITGSLGFIMLSSILGIIVHFLLALYFDAVLPNKYGVQKAPLFFLEYLTHYKQNKVRSNYDCISTNSLTGKPEVLEDVPENVLMPWIEIRNLSKCFMCGNCTIPGCRSSTVKAIRGMSLNFYKGQITALLGRNGAGKTTTFSILTGSTPPSEGSVYINKKDISKDLDSIRSDLGVCPQENTMFPDLTVQEQLQIMSRLKQLDKEKKELNRMSNDMLEKLRLEEKKDAMPHMLSGGQKRRLCLGMALIGNASTIFLDEPTSGMDPETRRHIWDLILKYRHEKTIIITTHSMEEADVLGDRIAIMQSGEMKCYGTPMYLKKYYGHNYHDVTLSTTPWCDKSTIQEMVGREAIVKVTHRGRMVISVPFTNALPEILDKMESQKAELGITGISVSAVSLEEVFLQASEEEKNYEPVDSVDGSEKSGETGYTCLTGSELTRQKIAALFRKKITYFRRNPHLWVAMILGALLAVLFPVFCPTYNKPMINRMFRLGLYQSPEALISSDNQIFGDIYKKIIESEGGTGTLVEATDDLSNELLSRATRDLMYYKSRMIISAEFNASLIANAFYSGGATLSAPITVNTMSNLVLKTVAGDQYSIVTSISELPRSLKPNTREKTAVRLRIVTQTILFIITFFHVLALFVKYPLVENLTKIKQLQRMAGVSAFLYWGTTFVIDYAFYIIVTIITVLGIFLRDSAENPNNFSPTEIGVLLLLFLLFGINSLLLAYIHSFMKKTFHHVYLVLSGVPLLLTIMVVLITQVLPYVENAEKANLLQRRIFSLYPHVSFVFGYIKYAEIASTNARCRGLSSRLSEAACTVCDICCSMKCSDGHCKNPLPYFNNFVKEGGLEEFVTYLLITPLILVGIIYLLEQQMFDKWRLKFAMDKPKSSGQHKPIDSEVEKEKSIVQQALNQRDSDSDEKNVFLVHGLSKSYGKLQAVKEVNFRVKENECFGLLGLNGAGKSTTFRMLVGEELSNNGILCRNPYDIKSNRTEYLNGMGYCPQNDAIIPYFNAVEHLTLFARLRGIPNSQVTTEVDSWIRKLQLNRRTPSMNCSGGNKRRLNIAIALIGNPKLVLLDEPTTGVDPAARRLVWTILQRCQESGQSIVLTSHSMAECETLCDRLVIMDKGRLLCVGASQELKKRFGAGFRIIIKLDPARSELDSIKIKNKIEESLVCELKDEHLGYLFYHVTDAKTTWAKMFGVINELKSKYDCIQDFTVSTATLEQLFMQFAKSAERNATESHKKTCIA